jgi:hypothetical protein
VGEGEERPRDPGVGLGGSEVANSCGGRSSILSEEEPLIFFGATLRLGKGDELGESNHGSALGFISLHTPVCFSTGVPDSKKLSPCHMASRMCFFHFTLSPFLSIPSVCQWRRM